MDKIVQELISPKGPNNLNHLDQETKDLLLLHLAKRLAVAEWKIDTMKNAFVGRLDDLEDFAQYSSGKHWRIHAVLSDEEDRS